MSQKIEHEGVISRINGDVVCVNIIQTSACSGCHAQSMCSVSEQKEKIIEIPYVNGEYQVGESVSVEGSSSMGLMAVVYSFIVPLFFIVLVLSLFLFLFKNEVLAALFSLLSLITYYILLYLLRDKFKKKFVFTLKKH